MNAKGKPPRGGEGPERRKKTPDAGRRKADAPRKRKKKNDEARAAKKPPAAPPDAPAETVEAPRTRVSEMPSAPIPPSVRASTIPPEPRIVSEPPPGAAEEAAALPPNDVEVRLRTLEERLGRMTASEEAEEAPPASIREQVSVAAREVAGRLAAPVARVDESTVTDTVRDLLSSDYYLRQWGRLGMRNRSEEVDEFGLDPVYEARFRPLLDFLYERYFRVETEGIDQVPSTGRCLVVANHSGTLPLDGLMLRTCFRREHPTGRELRFLAEDFVYYLPFAGAFLGRVGGVRACQENAERLLRKENLVAVFPEGVKGIGKLYRDRYRLQRFGRGGFIRLCLRTGTPLVPCAIIGAEEASPMLYRDETVSKLLGLPYLPITPTFPWLGPLGLLPAPTKWRIEFGEMIRFDGHGPEAADDSVLVGRLSDRVRASIQQMLDSSLSERKSVWFG